MANLELSGMLDLSGNLDLSGADGGKVLVAGAEALVELAPTARPAHGSAPPVILPPPP